MENGYEVRQTLKKQTKMTRFILEGLQLSLKHFYWLVVNSQKKKHTTKTFARFHNHSTLLTMYSLNGKSSQTATYRLSLFRTL